VLISDKPIKELIREESPNTADLPAT
jgi:hypothetical protein